MVYRGRKAQEMSDIVMEPTTNGSVTGLEARIQKELSVRRAAMEARAANGEDLYQSLRAVTNSYKNLESKNIPAGARRALVAAGELLAKIDTESAS